MCGGVDEEPRHGCRRMIALNQHQLEVADAATGTATAKRYGVAVERIRQIVVKVARYREWHAMDIDEQALSLSMRRVRSMSFPTKTRNALIWNDIETKEQPCR
jgi:hypothetical protein